MASNIHPTAIISEDAVIDPSTTVGPYVVIDGNARIGKSNNIMTRAYIGGNTTIGDNNEIHMGAIVGHDPQDRAFKKGEISYLRVGNNNIIREYATIHRGSLENAVTEIGNHCLIMGGAHIAHDCKLGNGVTMANMSGIAGYVELADRAIVAGGAMIHQFVKVGTLAMVSGNARISMDIPPFMIAAEKNQIWAMNMVGIQRANIPSEIIHELRELYRIVIRKQAPLSTLLKEAEEKSFQSQEAKDFIDFVKNSKRGICASAHLSKE